MQLNGVDLHAHSNASDGTDTPAALVEKAATLGLSAIALTDHDTITGLPEALERAEALHLELVPGIELSIEDGEDRRFHLLSYFFDQHNEPLSDVLVRVRRWRTDRNALMIGRAQAAGIDLTLDDVQAAAGADATVIGRPHFAAALMKKGLAKSIADAFDKYLASGRPLNEPKPSLSPGQAAELLHGAGGITVLAHPGLIKWADRDRLTGYIRSLKDADALDGIECYYPRHTPEQTDHFLRIAHEFDLLVSGGSDYHGANKPDIELGVIRENGPVPAALLEPLRAASNRRLLATQASV